MSDQKNESPPMPNVPPARDVTAPANRAPVFTDAKPSGWKQPPPKQIPALEGYVLTPPTPAREEPSSLGPVSPIMTPAGAMEHARAIDAQMRKSLGLKPIAPSFFDQPSGDPRPAPAAPSRGGPPGGREMKRSAVAAASHEPARRREAPLSIRIAGAIGRALGLNRGAR